MSKLCEEYERSWCDRKSNDLDFSVNMRLRSFIVRYDFCMWDSWCFRTEVREDENEEVSEQLNDSFLIDCDVILSVAIVRFERFDEVTVLKNVSDSNIWFRDVAERIDWANCEVSEQVTADFSAILYADSSVETRKSELLTDFRTLCSWMCSKSSLLKSKSCLHCLHDDFCEGSEHAIVDFSSDFDVILSLAIERCESLCETEREDISAENIWLRDVAEKIDDFCEASEANEQMLADFSMILYVSSDAKTRRFKLLTDFRAWCSRICSWSLLLKLKSCLQRLQIRAQAICWIESLFIDFDADSSVDIWKVARSAFILTRMWTVWARILAIDFAFSANKSDVVFVSFDVILDVVIERCELLSETSCKNIFVFVTRFLEVAKNVDDFCDDDEHTIANVFSDSHINLNVEFVRDALMIENFWIEISWCFDSNVWENDDFSEITKHWVDLFFFRFWYIFWCMNWEMRTFLWNDCFENECWFEYLLWCCNKNLQLRRIERFHNSWFFCDFARWLDCIDQKKWIVNWRILNIEFLTFLSKDLQFLRSKQSRHILDCWLFFCFAYWFECMRSKRRVEDKLLCMLLAFVLAKKFFELERLLAMSTRCWFLRWIWFNFQCKKWEIRTF